MTGSRTQAGTHGGARAATPARAPSGRGRTAAVAALLVLGLVQMAADLLGVASLKGLAAATCASPAPKVFSSAQGLETFSTRFFLEWTDAAGAAQSVELTPAMYARVRGPYNRRNVFGAALAYGPVLESDARTRAMFRSVSHYAMCEPASLLHEVGVEPPPGAAPSVRLLPRAGAEPRNLPLTIRPACDAPRSTAATGATQ